MTTRIDRLITAAILTLLLGACSTEAPPETQVDRLAVTTRSSSSGIAASFTSSEGCHYASVHVSADENVWNAARGAPTGSASASLFVFYADRCAESGWDVLASGSGWTTLRGGEFTMRGNLGGARLRTTIDMYDWVSETSFSSDIDLEWSAVGDAWHWRDRRHEETDGVKYRFRGESMGRSATVTGQVDLAVLGMTLPLPGAGWMGHDRHSTSIIETGKARHTPPEIGYLHAFPHEIRSGGTAALSWWVPGVEPIALSIDQGVGDVTGTDHLMVSPTETTTYVLTASNKWGSVTAQVTVVVLPPIEPDDLEDNDEPASATPIDLDYFGEGLTITPGDVDWFVFTLDAPSIVTIDVWESGPGLSPQGRLYDADQTSIVLVGSSYHLLLMPGMYYLAVTGSPDEDFLGYHEEAGGYHLLVTSVAPPPDDRFEPNDSPSFAASIERDFFADDLTLAPGDVDWFTFTLDEAVIMAFRASGTLSAMFDAELNWLSSLDGLEALVLPGTYYVAVTGYPDYQFVGDHRQSTSYTLTISSVVAPPFDVYEPNDTPEEATVIGLPFSSSALTITPGNVDWFTFTLTVPSTVRAELDTSTSRPDFGMLLALHDDHGLRLALNDDRYEPHQWIEIVLDPGTYTVGTTGWPDYGFTGFHSEYGHYGLAVTAHP
jgi:hypothetical protein